MNGRDWGIYYASVALDLGIDGPEDLEMQAREARNILTAVLGGKWDDYTHQREETDMQTSTFTLVIETETEEQAHIVLSERLGYDEEYDDPTTGEPFDYRINIAELDPTQRGDNA